MTAFCIGLAVCGGLPIAWHLRAVARRWPDTPERLSRSEAAVAAAGSPLPGLDRSPHQKEPHR